VRRAFTLIEVLVVVGIAGIVIAAGVVPLVYTVRMISEARASFAEQNRERSAINRIIADTVGVISLNESGVVRVIRRDELQGGRDYLVLYSMTSAYSLQPMGAVVLGMPPESVIDDDYMEGLHRWTLSGDVRPESFTMDSLIRDSARLILPGASGVSFSVLSGADWVEEYSGGMPQALRILLEYGDDGDEKVYEVWLPKF
jgi:prepilin-type N-terminal cleavage/methylation domain-containing protein